MVKTLERVRLSLEDIYNKASKKVVDSHLDDDFLSTSGPKFADRFAKVMKDVGRIVTAVAGHKGQGHSVQKNSEVLVNLSKVTHNQAGSVIYNEAPVVMSSGRVVVTRGATAVTEVADALVKADTEQHRVNHYVISAGKVSKLVTGDDLQVVDGHYKRIQKSSSKDSILQAGRDFIAKTIHGAVKLLSKTTFTVEAQQAIKISTGASVTLEGSTMSLTSGGSMTIGSAGVMTLVGSVVNIQAAGVINLGGGSPPSPPAAPSAPTEDTLSPQSSTSIPAIDATGSDNKPGVIMSTRPGLNPAGAVPLRVNKNDEANR
jgi:hypothetical protein